MKPVCVKCERFMRLRNSGYYFTEGMPAAGCFHDAKPGKAEPEKWQPYKIWSADLYECPDCGVRVLSGYGALPIRERHHKDFEEVRQHIRADRLLVKDC